MDAQTEGLDAFRLYSCTTTTTPFCGTKNISPADSYEQQHSFSAVERDESGPPIFFPRRQWLTVDPR